MAEHASEAEAEARTGTARGAGRARTAHGRPARLLLGVAAIVPLLLAGGALALAPDREPAAAEHVRATASPGPRSLACHGPLQVPDEALQTGGDAALAVTPPTPSVSLRTVAAEPASSVLFGEVSGSSTRQDAEGAVPAPAVTAADAEGEELSGDAASTDLGIAVQTLRHVRTAPQVTAQTSEGGRPVADAVQGTWTASGDFRSLSMSRCAEPTTEASFLGVSTQTGDSSVLVLSNPSDRPATASVQLRTADGPAAMEGRSQVVVAPGDEERVLLESVVPGEDAVGVDVSVLGAPLSLHVQTTERDGLTPGGAEILDPLPAPAQELIMPGVDVAGTAPALVLSNPSGSTVTADVEVLGADGAASGASPAQIEVPAGAVVPTALEGLADGTYAVQVSADGPLEAVTRSFRTGKDLPGDTVGAPVDFTLVAPAPALGTHAVSALPGQGATGALTLTASEDTEVSVVPIGADGAAGEPIAVDLAAGATSTLTHEQLRLGGEGAAALSIVPEVPGAVHASWTQRQSDGAGGVLLSTLPVLPDAGDVDSVQVVLTD
ncbi:DUF5719 family protein [Brachybacterium sp. GU-2]|uniref:DUF5719 family protein n=1 Tax=Brachybacterium sp. GU-2 TaxID=3069708 RepID=UPI00280ACBB3|nr:DUF5719 family protein [Brachybacterium sp. GU-2]WME21715.1 DUF5719 family protein [Brachybacterium sp. GU-2]